MLVCYDMFRLEFVLALIPCHSFTCLFINAICVVLLRSKYKVSLSLEMSMHLCFGFVLTIRLNMLRRMMGTQT